MPSLGEHILILTSEDDAPIGISSERSQNTGYYEIYPRQLGCGWDIPILSPELCSGRAKLS
ncbi:hypothetical protein KKF25_03205, partial [Patescibacteria group bacterium]|nr:hypothetical protein [Patescibacteria group bacterium]